MSGAEFSVTGPGVNATGLKTNNQGEILVNIPSPGGTFTVTETAPAPGYFPADPDSKKVTINASNRTGTVTFLNEPDDPSDEPDDDEYEIITEGTGEIPTENDRVKVHYTGTFLDGKVFDSSVERGSPAVFGVTQVIKGWTEALQLMPVGSKWKLYIPYDLAYGTQDRGSIPPYSTLVFEVELLGIE